LRKKSRQLFPSVEDKRHPLKKKSTATSRSREKGGGLEERIKKGGDVAFFLDAKTDEEKDEPNLQKKKTKIG